jgi:AraC-like DNA-binding protein
VRRVPELRKAKHRAKSELDESAVQRGAFSCEAEGGLWIVPPRSAVWIPGGALHAVKATGVLECYNAFVDPAVDARLPEVCCVVSVTPLLCELLVRSASLPLLYAEGGPNSRLVVMVLLDELAAAQVEDLHLPMPTDARLRRIVDLMMASPAERGTLDVWAKRAGLSERTLARLISRETGMSFGRWRQQLGVVLAVKWLAGGASIQQVAADLGYENVPSLKGTWHFAGSLHGGTAFGPLVRFQEIGGLHPAAVFDEAGCAKASRPAAGAIFRFRFSTTWS